MMTERDGSRPRFDYDCLIVGGGPAGLTAAIYLARFHLSVLVVDAEKSRAALIPLSRNHAGFPEGVSGADLLGRMRAQARTYGAELRENLVRSLQRAAEGFIAEVGDERLRANMVLLSTGVVNRRPPMMDDACHDEALASGRLRYCPICDGYEVTDQRVAVLGTGEHGHKEAIFLRGYSADITLVAPDQSHAFDNEQRSQLLDAGIRIAGRCSASRLVDDGIELVIDGRPERFDTLYPALGSDIRSELAGQVGASRSADGCLIVDAHQRTDIAGLYAAGDVVLGLDQISHAMGEGGVAATTIRNDLARKTPLRR